MAEYRNRTSFVDLNLAGCQAAVRTHRVTLSDNGSYHCLFMEDTAHDSTTLWLQVAGLGSSPRIQVIHTQNRGVWAEYASEGWYPEPWVEWRNQRGQMVHAETNFSVLATTGLLAVVSRVALLDRAVEGLSCSITSPLLPERKVAESHLPACLSRESQFTKWTLALPVSLLAMGLVMAGVICLFGKCQRNAHRTQLRQETERRGEEQSQQSSMGRAVTLHVSPSLDPDTRSPKLIVSEDQKSVRRLLFNQDLPPSAKRFEQDPCILAQEQFWAARHDRLAQAMQKTSQRPHDLQEDTLSDFKPSLRQDDIILRFMP